MNDVAIKSVRRCIICEIDISHRPGQARVCSETCSKARAQNRYLENREEILAYTHQYRLDHKEKINARKRRSRKVARAADPEKEKARARERMRRLKEKDPEAYNAKRRDAERRRREKDPEAYYAKAREKQRLRRDTDEWREKKRREYAEMSAARKALKELNLL